jgi:hypothetical protein
MLEEGDGNEKSDEAGHKDEIELRHKDETEPGPEQGGHEILQNVQCRY